MTKIILLFSIFFITGCGEERLKEIEGQAAIIAMIMLFASIAFLSISKNIQNWSFTKILMKFFITKVSLFIIFLMCFVAIILFFNDNLIGYLFAINLIISAAFLYRLRYKYEEKDDNIKVMETRYFTITLPTIVALGFLYSGGLEKLFR